MTRIERLLSKFMGDDWTRRVLSGKHPAAESTGDVTITLPRAQWEAVVTTMEWELPDLDDHTERAEWLRDLSERCFAASRQIHEALDHELIRGHVEVTR